VTHQLIILADAVRRISADAGGALELYIVLDQDRAQLALQAAEGEDVAVQLHEGVEDMRRSVAAAPRRLPIRCVGCTRLLKKSAYAVVVAGRAGHRQRRGPSILHPLCHQDGPGARPCRPCAATALAERSAGGTKLRWSGRFGS